MFPPVATKDPTAVEQKVQSAWAAMFPDGDSNFVARAFEWTRECFAGHYKDYQRIDARFHDMEHTMQGTLCMARLLRGRHRAAAKPPLTEHMFQLGLLAMLLHDTGYLKKREDIEGTGAKYTITHVNRSAEFAGELLGEKKYDPDDIASVQRMIRCTGVDALLSVIPFQNELERITGFALGTGDLLGQMAAEDYVDKLPILYSEFAEAAAYTNNRNHFVATFASALDLMQKTPAFWENYVMVKLNRDFAGVYRFLNDPYPDGPNDYLNRIEVNIERLRQRIATFVI